MSKKKIFDIIFYTIIGSIILYGAILRTQVYLIERPLWHDECRLALNILERSIPEYFQSLTYEQVAPPLFMAITKLFTLMFGIREMAIRFVPFAAGIIALPVFYFFSRLFLEKKWSVVAANLLFAINFTVILYTQEFKQYSSDVMSFMLALILGTKIDFNSINKKQACFLGVLCMLIPMFSMPAAFVLGAFLIVKIAKIIHSKKETLTNFIIFLLPFCAGMMYYYISYVRHFKLTYTAVFMDDFWVDGFLLLKPCNIMTLLSRNLDYFFPGGFNFNLGFILLLLGFCCFIINTKKERYLTAVLTLVLVFTASYLHIYPICDRTAVYLIPITIILLIKPLDFIQLDRKIYSFIVIMCTIWYFSAYNLKDIWVVKYAEHNIVYKSDARKIMQIMKENYTPGEYVVISGDSQPEYLFYSQFLGFKPDKDIVIRQNLKQDAKNRFYNNLNKLEKDRTYWFYFAFQFVEYIPITGYLKHWKNDKEVLSEFETHSSYLLHLKNRRRQ